jgi:hypothetical protein
LRSAIGIGEECWEIISNIGCAHTPIIVDSTFHDPVEFKRFLEIVTQLLSGHCPHAAGPTVIAVSFLARRGDLLG